MKLFFDRTETENKTVIVLKPYSMYLLLAVLILLGAITFVPALAAYEYLANYFMPIAALVIIGRIIFTYKINKEIQQAISQNNVTVTGGKLSATKPLTFTIKRK